MSYQLVIQFRGDSLQDYDAMMTLEDQLSEALDHSAKVDGHDCGAGEANIFIFTSAPALTFERIRHILQQIGKLDSVTAAYRETEGAHYTVIWPEGSREEFRIA